MAWNVEVVIIDPSVETVDDAVPDIFVPSHEVDLFEEASSVMISPGMAVKNFAGKTWVIDVACRLTVNPPYVQQYLKRVSRGRSVHLCRVSERPRFIVVRDCVREVLRDDKSLKSGEARGWAFLSRVSGVKCPKALLKEARGWQILTP